ncbi:DUF2752 domain-containing protein [Aeromicrobium sp.]|uniref:DUF2752 domain-containing protein n=1 Tax=Aeromicrobium sp. TaxID=1871063 RepID=UPI003D6A1603
MTTHVASRSTTELMRGPALVGAAGLGAAALLRLHDPHDPGSYGFCPFLVITGHPCPGCGGLRAVNDLTHGDVVAAISSNLLAVALVAMLALTWTVWVVRRIRGVDGPMVVPTNRVLLLLLGVALVFGVLRNTPWGAWLAP